MFMLILVGLKGQINEIEKQGTFLHRDPQNGVIPTKQRVSIVCALLPRMYRFCGSSSGKKGVQSLLAKLGEHNNLVGPSH